MSVTFRLPSAHALDLLGFGWSPLFEAVLSLPIVVEPKRTPIHLPWARRCRNLPPDLLDEIGMLFGRFETARGGAQLMGGFVPGFFEVGIGTDLPTFEAELDALTKVDEQLVAYELSLAYGGSACGLHDGYHQLDLFDDPTYRQQVLDVAAPDRRMAELAQALFDDPMAIRDRYVRVLRRYWEEAFHDEWERILPRIEAEVTAGAHAFVTGGASRLVHELLPEATWDGATNSITIEKPWSDVCEVAERGRLLLVPTVYGWPRVLVEEAPPWPLMIIFPLRDMRHPAMPQASDAEVIDGFRAIGDETRLQIARLVAEHPRSTSELAALLSLSDSAISRHLKILQAAGLVDSQRDGYFVLYRLDPTRLDTLGRALHSTLGLSPGPSADVPPLPVTVHRSTED